jgi:hypothetical protein
MIVGDLVKYTNAYCESVKTYSFAEGTLLDAVALVKEIGVSSGYYYALVEWVGQPDPVTGGAWITSETLSNLEVV